mmetsp:Transcript_23763/g.52131  ORF Transcript_23763/g.52131 Transcript_23763/m.52131 type:complete len:150 (+) Transcript_23763:37-486(+)|eukprot:CAMPEP_0202891194 /NCGR_PEP_ID=MMETSP1392-20130828/1319_1 /ASSEMBLY_ACC=CAM_ASM_000868 /TAXON_ID=225041 /ORGANISM="Chlamydomonas chlamydogama, Strain SAG 11-48b" /LENGTH=149 /DNA_ID=CAMNT_0049574879 /DNA_START=37 /DNA_END=486 /DNA_ORIENTATION=+
MATSALVQVRNGVAFKTAVPRGAAARSLRSVSRPPARLTGHTLPISHPLSSGFSGFHSNSRSRLIACNGLFGLGLPEIAVIAGIAALVFGPSKLPELGKGLGKTVKSFQSAAKEFETELKAAAASDDAKDAKDAKDAPAAQAQKPEEKK